MVWSGENMRHIDIDQVVERLRQGATLGAVALDLGVSYSTLAGRCRDSGVRVADHAASDLYDRLEALAAAGRCHREARADLGLDREQLKLLLRRYRRRRGPISLGTDPYQYFSPDQVEAIRTWSGEGRTQKQIASDLRRVYGLRTTQPTVADVMARHKIEPRGRTLPPVRGWVEVEGTEDRRTPMMW